MENMDSLKKIILKCKIYLLKSKMESHKRHVYEYCIRHNLNMDHFLEREDDTTKNNNRKLKVYQDRLKEMKKEV